MCDASMYLLIYLIFSEHSQDEMTTVKSPRKLHERNPHKHWFLPQTPMAAHAKPVLHNCE